MAGFLAEGLGEAKRTSRRRGAERDEPRLNRGRLTRTQRFAARRGGDAARADPVDPVPERRRGRRCGVFVERQTLGARRARRTSSSRSSRRSACRSGRCRSIRIMRRCGRCRARRAGKGLDGPPPALPGLAADRRARHGAARWPTRCCRCFARFGRAFPFDVIDAEFFWPDGPAAMRLARGARRALLDQGARQRHPSLGRAPGIARADRRGRRGGRTACSRSARALKADMVGARHAGATGSGSTIPASTSTASGRSTAPRRRRRLGVDGPLLVAAGALIRAQGPGSGDRGADAAPRRDPAHRRRRARPRPSSSALARRLGLASRVRFLGVRPHEELPALLAAADVAVLPTRATRASPMSGSRRSPAARRS